MKSQVGVCVWRESIKNAENTLAVSKLMHRYNVFLASFPVLPTPAFVLQVIGVKIYDFVIVGINIVGTTSYTSPCDTGPGLSSTSPATISSQLSASSSRSIEETEVLANFHKRCRRIIQLLSNGATVGLANTQKRCR